VKIDLVFVVDDSQSIGPDNYVKVLASVDAVVR
jgi:hypothetical protein